MLLAIYIYLEYVMAIGTIEQSLVIVHSHMPTYTASSDEHHDTIHALELSLAKVRLQVVVGR